MTIPASAAHVLAGDDSPRILELFRDLLEPEGYRLTLSADPLDLDRVKQLAPDLVILDHMLDDGEGSGWQLLRDLRDDPSTAALPVVVCTGAVHRVREKSGLLEELRARVVLKPFDIAEFLTTVDDACRTPLNSSAYQDATVPGASAAD